MKTKSTSPNDTLQPNHDAPEPIRIESMLSADLEPLPGEQDQDYLPLTLPEIPDSERPNRPKS